MRCFITGYADKKDMATAPLWEPGKFLVEGDSNIHLMNVKKRIHKDCFNIGQGGDIPQGVIDQFPFVKERHRRVPIDKAYIQIGGNVWILGDCSSVKLQEDIRKIAQLYKQVVKPKDLVIASLPWVNPKLTMGDRFPIKHLDSVKIVDVFAEASIRIALVCQEEGIKFLDIFNPLKKLWDIYGKSYWWDDVHYAIKAQDRIGLLIRAAWGIP